MNDIMKNARLNPYDLSGIRRTAATAPPKAPASMRQPYTLALSQRIVKSPVVVRPKKGF